MELVHPHGLGSQVDNDELNISFSPPPDYSGIARAASNNTALAVKVEEASDLERVLRVAIDAVHNGRTAIIDAVIQKPQPQHAVRGQKL
jgi:hypothetical protein